MKFSPRTFRVSFSLFRKVETIKHITSVEHINYKTSTTTKQWTLETTYSRRFLSSSLRRVAFVDGRRRERTPTSSLDLFPSSLPNYYTEHKRRLRSLSHFNRSLCYYYYLESLMMLIRAKLFPSNASVYFSTKSLQFSKWFTPSFR